VNGIARQGLPMLAAAFRMLHIPAGPTGGSNSNSSGIKIGGGLISSTTVAATGMDQRAAQGTASTGRSGASSTSKAGSTGSTSTSSNYNREPQSKGKASSARGASSTGNRDAVSFIKAWLHSPLGMEDFYKLCGRVGPTHDCMSKVLGGWGFGGRGRQPQKLL
jgi:hypothetical protein